MINELLLDRLVQKERPDDVRAKQLPECRLLVPCSGYALHQFGELMRVQKRGALVLREASRAVVARQRRIEVAHKKMSALQRGTKSIQVARDLHPMKMKLIGICVVSHFGSRRRRLHGLQQAPHLLLGWCILGATAALNCCGQVHHFSVYKNARASRRH